MSGGNNNRGAKSWRWMSSVLLTMVIVPAADGYNTDIHERLTRIAFDRSVLTDTVAGPLAGLGIADPGEQQFYSIPPADLSGVLAGARDLVALGAVYEDHPEPSLLRPQSEWRFMRHFFDPQQNGQGLLGFPSSRAWVLDTQNDVPLQEFSLGDAHQVYLDALTMSTEPARRNKTVLLLQSLGRAVHHLQDMAQPAHARDDIHPPYPLDNDDYEAYTSEFFAQGSHPIPTDAFCGQVPIELEQFDTAEKFWSNAGTGIAEFSSHNFVSEDTNFTLLPTGTLATDLLHSLPASTGASFVTKTLGELGVTGAGASWSLDFLALPVTDALSNSGCTNERAAVVSMLSAATPGVYRSLEMNHFTFEANYPILLPRAIAYSAALLDYIFRGRLALESYQVSASTVQVVIRNVSAGQFALSDGSQESPEEFSVYYDGADGVRHRLALQNDDLNGVTIEHGETFSLSFVAPAEVLEEGDGKPFLLVFNGKVGNEPGIVSLPLSPKSAALLVTPNYVPADGISGPRVLVQESGVWSVGEQSGAVAGNVDWRGHAPDEVLTWHGPQGRYFGTPGNSPNIYQGGRLLSVAPGRVIGAAISKQGGQRFLIGATSDVGSGLRIYRRPYQSQYQKDGLYHELNNPLGWQLIYSGGGSGTNSPLFFNASGTEGQAMVGFQGRIKVTIAGDAATSTYLPNSGTYTRIHDSVRTYQSERDHSPAANACHTDLECTQQGQCTTENGGVLHDVCVAAKAEEHTVYGVTVESTSTETAGSTVVCADYRGDTEVLCTVEPDETDVGIYHLDSTSYWDATKLSTSAPSCTPVRSGPQQFRHSYNETSSSNSVMVFRVGARAIPLKGTRFTSERHHNTRHLTEYMAPWPGPPMVDYQLQSDRFEFDTKLLYVDARYDIVAYEDHAEQESISSTGTAPATQHPFGDYEFEATKARTMHYTSRTVVLADQEYELASNHSTQSEPFTGREPAGFRSVTIESCSPQGPEHSHEEKELSRSTGELVSALHPKLTEGQPLSLSALSEDAFVASIPIWVRQPDSSYVRQGTWNHFSGGNLGTLLPPTTPAPLTYYPTGIVK